MDWPVPAPADIAERSYASFEAAFEFDDQGNPTQVDPRTPNSAMDVISRVEGEGMFDLYLYQANCALELFPDTAKQTVQRHGDIWGVPRLAATFASGPVDVTGAAGTPIPAGTTWSNAGVSYVSSTGTTMGTASILTLDVVASVSGTVGNLAGGTPLTLVSGIGGILLSGVNAAGIGGGGPQETIDAWKVRILERIRFVMFGGRKQDYQQWAQEAGATYVNVVPGWVGYGSVGIVVALDGPSVPSAEQVAAIQAYIDGVRPVTVADCIVVPAVLTPVNLVLSLNPDTVGNEAAAQAGAAAYFATKGEIGIGSTLRVSRLDEAISSASGAYSNELLAPAVDTAFGRTQLPVLGTITFGVSS